MCKIFSDGVVDTHEYLNYFQEIQLKLYKVLAVYGVHFL
jgi:hypothetical protein